MIITSQTRDFGLCGVTAAALFMLALFCPGRIIHRATYFKGVTDVSQTITFPDKTFPGKTFPGQLRALTVDYFPYKTFPGQSFSRTDVSRTICINNLEYFGMFM